MHVITNNEMQLTMFVQLSGKHFKDISGFQEWKCHFCLTRKNPGFCHGLRLFSLAWEV